MFSVRNAVTVSATLLATVAFVACSSGDGATAPVAPTDMFSANTSGTAAGTSINATIRIRCELRTGKSSKISVDGNNLTPLNGSWRAGVRSGGVTITHPLKQGVLDQVEFDFSSDPNDIAAGARPIPANFIVPNPSGPDVQAAIALPNGTRVVTGGADCVVR